MRPMKRSEIGRKAPRPLACVLLLVLLKRFSRSCYVPAFSQELADRPLLNPFLDSQFVVQEMVGDGSRRAIVGVGVGINAVDANAIAVAIGADQAHLQVSCFGFPDGRCGS